MFYYDEEAADEKLMFYKEKKNNVVWRCYSEDRLVEMCFSFDKKKILQLWEDYPYNFTEEELKIFEKEQKWLLDYFHLWDRKKK